MQQYRSEVDVHWYIAVQPYLCSTVRVCYIASVHRDIITALPQYICTSVHQYSNASVHQYMSSALPRYISTTVPQYISGAALPLMCAASAALPLLCAASAAVQHCRPLPMCPCLRVWLNLAYLGTHTYLFMHTTRAATT